MTGNGQAKIAYWVYNYMPKWEAASMEVTALRSEFGKTYDTYLIAQNTISKQLSIFGKNKVLPLPFSLAALPLFPRIASSYHINHIFSSPAEPLLLPRIGHKNTILTITKDSDSLKGLEKNISHLKKLEYIVVESEWHKELLYQAGINGRRVRLIYPGAAVKAYQPASGPFKVLFATSPMSQDLFLSRGIFLILQAARQLPEIQFIFTWREKNYTRLSELIEEAGVSNVEVKNGFIPDMDQVYSSVHATVLPGLVSSSLKPTPHSALNSLAHGKPVLISRPTSIAPLVERNQCGVVFDPAVDQLVLAVRHLQENYPLYQQNCHPTIKNCFSDHYFFAGYRELYQNMLNQPQQSSNL